eukprot:CAMPEP_0168816030 /NCGR_PEP_ID=MMETSP0726-20121227/6513_1 /TAXON_ID=265536 /ORGANISM="Amphiprora sp., Strain CCMP467" /LENGTH=693 /DNA_ID=CAMNT_0008868277 /DNA_START=38 /DNA_END=2115 /DNA_ORIENTATION=-
MIASIHSLVLRISCFALLLPTGWSWGVLDWVEDTVSDGVDWVEDAADNAADALCDPNNQGSCGGHRQPACIFPCDPCDNGKEEIRMSAEQTAIVLVAGGQTPCKAEGNGCTSGAVTNVCVEGVNDEKKERLAAQHRLDYTAPLDQVTWVGTHNSYAATDQGFNEYANHKKGPKVQLEAGFRVLNYDLHNLGDDDPVLCHDGTEQELFCRSLSGGHEEPFSWGLNQIKSFLDSNDGEVILLVLEDYFDDNVGTGSKANLQDEARKKAVENIAAILGPKVYSPEKHHNLNSSGGYPSDPQGRCNKAQLPFSTLTKQEILDGATTNSAIVIITPQASYDNGEITRYSSCCTCSGDSINWRKWVWEVPNNNIDTYAGGSGLKSPNSSDRPQGRMLGIFEDRAFNKANMIFNPGNLKFLMEKLPHMVGLDYAVIYDRYDDFLWSWGENEPASSSTGNDCAVLNEYDANSGAFAWKATACNEQYNVACWKEGSDSWKVTSTTHSFDSNIGNACREEYGPGWKFRMPYNAFQNKSLKQAAETTGATNIYIPYKREGSSWTDQCGPNGCSVPTAAPTTAPTTTPTASPSATPTATPTASPTSRPTASPTSSPTAYPTASPSTSPTYMVTGCKGRGVSCRRVCLDIEARDCIYQAEQDPYNVGPRCSRLLRQAERYGCLVESSVTPEATSTNAFGMMGGMMV